MVAPSVFLTFVRIKCPTQENLFHADGLKLWEAVQGTSQQLQSLVGEVCAETAKKLTDADVNFFPMIIQNWMIDLFINELPADAAARLWHRIILDNRPGVPLKFAQRLLLSKNAEILTCRPEDIHEVLTKIPNGIRSAEDVDLLLETDPTWKRIRLAVGSVSKRRSTSGSFLGSSLPGCPNDGSLGNSLRWPWLYHGCFCMQLQCTSPVSVALRDHLRFADHV
eukprot:s5147_g1.t1